MCNTHNARHSSRRNLAVRECALCVDGQQGKSTFSDEWPPPAPYSLPNSFTTASAHWKSSSVTKAPYALG